MVTEPTKVYWPDVRINDDLAQALIDPDAAGIAMTGMVELGIEPNAGANTARTDDPDD